MWNFLFGKSYFREGMEMRAQEGLMEHAKLYHESLAAAERRAKEAYGEMDLREKLRQTAVEAAQPSKKARKKHRELQEIDLELQLLKARRTLRAAKQELRDLKNGVITAPAPVSMSGDAGDEGDDDDDIFS